MKFAYILVEGATELEFVRSVLKPHFVDLGMQMQGIQVITRRVGGDAAHRGGHVRYEQFQRQIRKLLQNTQATLVSTMFDYYGLGADFPLPVKTQTGRAVDRVLALEKSVEQDVNDPRFRAYFALHEFEAMLFVDPDVVARVTQSIAARSELMAIANNFATPEDINDHPSTAPSKRLANCIANYDKTFHGPYVTMEIGLAKLRQGCPHFGQWLNMMETIVTQPDKPKG